MDGDRFDRLTRIFAGARSRRTALKALASGIAGAAGLAAVNEADAARCRRAGEICRKGPDCCSQTCGAPDNRGRRRCQCRNASDCPTPSSGCKTAVCTEGICGTANACTGDQVCYGNGCCTPESLDTTCAAQCGEVKNNCGQPVNCGPCCGEIGAECTDLPNTCCDGLFCVEETCIECRDSNDCSGDTPYCEPISHTCVECLDTDQCFSATSIAACSSVACINNICDVEYAPEGTFIRDETPGDCQATFCDGAGNEVPGAYDIDVPDDGNECTQDTCQDGVPANSPHESGTDCSTGVCDGSGSCVECVTDDHCSGGFICCSDNNCYDPTENATCGDCDNDCTSTSQYCDGNGACVDCNFDFDCLGDDVICCSNQCVSSIADETCGSCSNNCAESGEYCDGEGGCIECRNDDDCFSDPYCSNNTCVSCIDLDQPCSDSSQCCDGRICSGFPTTTCMNQ